MPLILGPVAFKDFEIPSEIDGLGGKQMHHVHKLVGGSRVVDALGYDPKPKSWSGRMRGADAESRAQTLEHLNAAGGMVPLSFGAYWFLVLISDLDIRYEKPQEIVYRITCEVVYDPASGVSGAMGAIGGILGALGGFGGMLGGFASLANIVGGADIAGLASVANVTSIVASDVSAITTTVASLSAITPVAFGGVAAAIPATVGELYGATA
jgi:hypothetical protein